MEKLKKIRDLEIESRKLRVLSAKMNLSFEKSIELRKEQDKKWFQLQLLKRMVK